jgi:hypothetical protein
LEHGAFLCRFRACGLAQLVGLGVHGSSRRQHSSVEVVEVLAVG